MYYEFKDLEVAIKNKDQKIKNFFDTFGFVVIRNIIKKEDFNKLLKEYDSEYERRTNEISIIKMIINRIGFSGEKKFGFKFILQKIINRGGMRFLPNFVDGSEKYFNYFFSYKFQGIYDYFAGKNWLYLGSDGSNFITTSFPWHRDWFTKIPLLKFNFYYNPLPFIGGKFLVIPGSNYAQDDYAQIIQKSMSWPMQNKLPGGLSENARLDKSENPRNIFTSIFKKYFTDKKEIKIPHVELNLNKGDLVIFDHRAVHCVQNNFPKFQRRLMTILLSKNAFDFNENHYLLQKYSKEELMSEIVDLVVNERNHIGCPPYGDALLNSEFVNSNHFIKIESSNKNHGKYDRGSFRTSYKNIFTSDLDFKKYELIGKQYREKLNKVNYEMKLEKDKNASQYSYEDVHLGINAQNIKDFEI